MSQNVYVPIIHSKLLYLYFNTENLLQRSKKDENQDIHDNDNVIIKDYQGIKGYEVFYMNIYIILKKKE